jgi:hypothetical protein
MKPFASGHLLSAEEHFNYLAKISQTCKSIDTKDIAISLSLA